MAKYEDLTPYEYFGYNPAIKNVGWIEGDDFSKGEVPYGFLDKLEVHLKHTLMHTRGSQICEYCIAENKSNQNGLSLPHGSSEIRIISKSGQVYACPELIYHYVAIHNYQPPQEFIEAVMNCLFPDSIEWRAALKEADKFYYAKKAKEIHDKKNAEEYKKCIDGMVSEIAKNIDKQIMNDIKNIK